MNKRTKIFSIVLGVILVSGIALYYGNAELFQGRMFTSSKPLPAYDENKCYDSDGGKNYEEAGTIYGKISRSEFGNKTDVCATQTKLKEYYCKGEFIQNQKYSCENGCSKGACKADGDYLISSEKCVEGQKYDCCGNDVLEGKMESLSTCPNDFNTHYNAYYRPVEKFRIKNHVNIVCIKPCPYTDEVFDAYSDKFFSLYDGIVDFLGYYPQIGVSDNTDEGYFSVDHYRPFTVVLGDSNVSLNDGGKLFPHAGNWGTTTLGCPTGICYADNGEYLYLNDESKIFWKLDYMGSVYEETENPSSELHEALHNFIPIYNCNDWNHGMILFLDNILSKGELFYEQYFDVMNYMYQNKVSFSDLPDSYIGAIYDASGSDYARAVGYIFLGGLFEYYDCGEDCIKGLMNDWIAGLNNEDKNMCYGNDLINIVSNNVNWDPVEWVEISGLATEDGLDGLKEKITSF